MNKKIRNVIYIITAVVLFVAYAVRKGLFFPYAPHITSEKIIQQGYRQNYQIDKDTPRNSSPVIPKANRSQNAIKISPPPKQLLAINDGRSHFMAILAKLHPDLDLSNKDIVELQHIYSWYAQEAVVYEAEVATVSAISENTNVVKIPAFPEAAKAFQAQLSQQISAYYQRDHRQLPQNLIADIAATFNSIGAYPQVLTIRLVNAPQYKYEVTREITFINPTTGAVLGQGKTVSQINSPYPSQERFFPETSPSS